MTGITDVEWLNNCIEEQAARIRELEAALEEADRQAEKLEALVEKVVAWEGKKPTHVIVPVEQPPIPELATDMQEFADRHKLGTFIQEVWRQAFRDAHRAMIRAAQPDPKQGE